MGFFRIFVVFSVAWLGWWGWQAYDANKQVTQANGWLLTIEQDLKLGRQPAFGRYETFSWKLEEEHRRDGAIKNGALGEVAALFVLLATLWIARGFKPQQEKRRPHLEAKLADIERRKAERASKPASTLGLIASIIFFPFLWLIDPGMMSNYWRKKK